MQNRLIAGLNGRVVVQDPDRKESCEQRSQQRRVDRRLDAQDLALKPLDGFGQLLRLGHDDHAFPDSRPPDPLQREAETIEERGQLPGRELAGTE